MLLSYRGQYKNLAARPDFYGVSEAHFAVLGY